MRKLIVFLMIVAIIVPAFSAVSVINSAESRVSIVELFTATWCTFCPKAEQVVSDAFKSDGGKFIFLEYHLGNDGLGTRETTNRGYFYGVSGTPTAVVNGKYKFIGTDRIKNEGLQRALFDSGKPVSVDFTNFSAVISGGRVSVTVSGESNAENPLSLFVILVEDNVEYKGKTYRFVARKINSFNNLKEKFNESTFFKIPGNYNQGNLYVIGFVQDVKTNEIYQAKKVKLSLALESPYILNAVSEIDNFPYTLNFSYIPGVDNYEVQFATDKNFYTVVKDEKREVPAFVIQKDKFISGEYFVRVRALKGDTESPWSNEQLIDIKVLKTILMKIGSPNMSIDGKEEEIDPNRDTSPVIINDWNRAVVPIRAIVEALGGSVGWNANTRTVTVTFTKRQLPPAPPLHTTYITMQVANPQATVNGIEKWIDDTNHSVKPVIINNRTMIPLRFVAESLGCTVKWDGVEKVITLIFEE